jgi:flavin reductase (DIM6/NTAB) family NADH-FMN oxidoreductase RutF
MERKSGDLGGPANPFVEVPLRARFFQSSAFFPMPVMLLSTRAPDGQVNLAPYSLCFPQIESEAYRLLLVTRSRSKTAQNLIATGRVNLNFIPDEPFYLEGCRALSEPVPTAEKMARSPFGLLPSARDEKAPPLVREAVQVFECELVSHESSDDEWRFVLSVVQISMQPYWARALETGRGAPRLPIDYGFRRGSERWTSKPRVVVSGPSLRPKFSVTVERPPEVVLEDFRAALGRSDLRIAGKIRGDVMQIGMPADERTTWSPSMDVHVQPSPQGTIVHGRIGPQPQVWTTFMFFHMMLALIGLGGLMWGVSSLAIGGSGDPLWIPLGALLMHLFVAGAAFIGQGLGAEQTHRLRALIDDVLGT